MFDPYSQWLKIPPGRRPPSHYELLDISPREADDPVAIMSAAERRSDQLLRYTGGQNAEDCVRIAAEVEEACKTLADPARRREYDNLLRRPADTKAAKNTKKTQPQPEGSPPVAPSTKAAAAPSAPAAAPRRRPWVIPTAVVAAIVFFLAGGLLAYCLNVPENKPDKTRHETVATAPVPLQMTAPERASPAPPSKPATTEPANALTATPPPAPPPARLAPERRNEKLPVPSEAQQDAAERSLRAKYAVDYLRLRTADDRLALAAKFLQPGREDRNNPAAWFVLLREARDLAIKADRPRLAVEAITELDRQFVVDPVAMALSALTTIAHPTTGERSALSTEARIRTFVSVALGRVKEALKADNTDAALKFLDLADGALTRLRSDKKLPAIIADRRKEVHKAQQELQVVLAAQELLKVQGDNPAANQVVGYHRACELGRWDEGLPLLAVGNDAVLRDAAIADLARPALPKAQVALADFWWTYARKHGGRGEGELQQHAAYWYSKALEELPDGTEKDRVLDRLDDARRFALAGGVRLAPGSFQGRDVENRILLLREGGGTMQSEEAVDQGLAWIAAHQSYDGGWRTDAFFEAARCTCPDPGRRHDVAGTAFGLLPLLAAGNTHRQGKYRRSVEAGLTFLIKHQAGEGHFGGERVSFHYEAALATITLCEAYAMTRDPALEIPALKAVNYIVQAQSPFGGWGYEARSLSPDMSVTLWQIWALKTAVNAGIYVPKETFDPMVAFLDRVAERSGQAYWYKPPGIGSKEKGPRPSLLPDGMLCRELLGWASEAKGVALSAKALMKVHAEAIKDRPSIYYMHFSRLALHHYGGKEWETWNPKTRDLLVELQDPGTEFGREHRKGSWSPVGEEWMAEGGRLMATSMATLGLEIYYSTVPINGFGPAVLND